MTIADPKPSYASMRSQLIRIEKVDADATDADEFEPLQFTQFRVHARRRPSI